MPGTVTEMAFQNQLVAVVDLFILFPRTLCDCSVIAVSTLISRSEQPVVGVFVRKLEGSHLTFILSL